MATAHQEKGVIARCIEFFGPLPDQSSEEFAAELKRLPEQDKRGPAELFNTADMPTAMPMLRASSGTSTELPPAPVRRSRAAIPAAAS